MLTRIVVGIGGGLATLGLIYYTNELTVTILMMFVCMIATFEFLVPTKAVQGKGLICVAIIISALLPLLIYLEPDAAPVTIFIAVVYGFIEILNSHKTNTSFKDVLIFLFASLIIPYFLSTLLQIFLSENGKFYILIPMISAWSSDTLALFTGMAFGKHKLAPNISPKKTVEGSIGGVLGGIIGMLIFTYIVRTYFAFDFSYVLAILIGVMGSVLGQIGDLSFSSIKRTYEIKDYGYIIPGHGGILDRFDSVIFVAPLVAMILEIVR